MSFTTAKSVPKEEPRYDFSAEPAEKRVLGFSGKLHSGKSTCRNFLMSLAMTHSLGILAYSYINAEGKIVGPKNEEEDAVVDIDSRDPAVIEYLDKNVWKFMRPFSMAAPLKEFCVNVLGLKDSLVYGTDAEKSELSDILWEDIPGYTGAKKGRMTGREVMEEFGTGIVRKLNPKAWANANKNAILSYGSLHSICDDVRFIDEIEDGLRPIGGKIIRLTLTTEKSRKNKHRSNCELDDYDKFDGVIDNAKHTSMGETFRELIEILFNWGWFKQVNQ